MKKIIENDQNSAVAATKKSVDRRSFLRLGGLAVAGTGLLLYSCDKDELEAEELLLINKSDAHFPDGRNVFNLGKGDLGILNYAYLLEQLEAAFYTEVINGDYFLNTATREEREILEDIYTHEIIHRDWFREVIASLRPSEARKPGVTFDFTSIDFSSRDAVLSTSILLEDTGVSAYNGAGPLLQNTDYLLLAGKIVSVEARHASAVRSLYLDNKAFAGDDVVDGNGLDLAASPQEVLNSVDSLNVVVTKIISNQLPS